MIFYRSKLNNVKVSLTKKNMTYGNVSMESEVNLRFIFVYFYVELKTL